MMSFARSNFNSAREKAEVSACSSNNLHDLSLFGSNP
jgi:hypothetical protein